jgi:hypothetical protein
MGFMTQQQEEELIETLLAFGWRNEDEFNRMSIDAALTYCNTDLEANGILEGLASRGLYAQKLEAGGELAVNQPMPQALSRWVRGTET